MQLVRDVQPSVKEDKAPIHSKQTCTHTYKHTHTHTHTERVNRKIAHLLYGSRTGFNAVLNINPKHQPPVSTGKTGIKNRTVRNVFMQCLHCLIFTTYM